MKKGTPYDQAIDKADRAERNLRRQSGYLEKMTRHGTQLPDQSQVHESLWKKLENGVSVWIVDGKKVRDLFDIDFTEGGHDHVYEFVPEKEVWIDNDVPQEERMFVLLHELHERNRMGDGWPYSKAHAESSKLEYQYRHQVDEVHDALEKEGWA